MQKKPRIILIKGKHAGTFTRIHPIERRIYLDHNVVLGVFIRIQAESIPGIHVLDARNRPPGRTPREPASGTARFHRDAPSHLRVRGAPSGTNSRVAGNSRRWPGRGRVIGISWPFLPPERRIVVIQRRFSVLTGIAGGLSCPLYFAGSRFASLVPHGTGPSFPARPRLRAAEPPGDRARGRRPSRTIERHRRERALHRLRPVPGRRRPGPYRVRHHPRRAGAAGGAKGNTTVCLAADPGNLSGGSGGGRPPGAVRAGCENGSDLGSVPSGLS